METRVCMLCIRFVRINPSIRGRFSRICVCMLCVCCRRLNDCLWWVIYKTDTSMHIRHVVVIYVETAVYMGGLIWIRLCM